MKVLIVGYGSIAKKHYSALKKTDESCKIIALILKTDIQTNEEIKNIYSWNDVPADIDFIIISNPTSEHLLSINEAVKLNKPLFIEKPLHLSLDVKDIIETINNKGIFTYIACNLRFLECIQFLKNQIQKKRLNEINVYCGSYLPDWRPNVDFRENYSAIPELGGGVHIDLIHELDYLYWLFGSPSKVCRNFRNKSTLKIPAFDYANYLLDYDGFCANVVLNYYRRTPKRSMELVYEDETWDIDLLKNQIKCDDKILFSSENIIADTYHAQMQYFIDCIKNNKESMNTVNDAYNVLKICFEK
ncbi:MAG: gfo/Idh/MocA family oxidoreductase [Bacteroidetes bacterium HGW-Bacteroidetes-21]|jgi:predicted dehydrogenase|nr:MAG: gfo/Idh/MocA family oxidoreductase [Bacteroidetes bacterium HGW-Bacteroidetes-21]